MTVAEARPGNRQTVLHGYVDAMPLDPGVRGDLDGVIAAGANEPKLTRFSRLHATLGALPEDENAAANVRRSAWARLRQALQQSPRKGDRELAGRIVESVQGELQLVTMPPLTRASMSPHPWDNNPFKRLWGWLKTLAVGRRGRMHARDPDEAPAPLKAARRPWRVNARWRRALLVSLIIVQTIAATYFMTAVMPFHGQHYLEWAILAIYAVLFAWISAGFWTAMMGFFTLLWRRDRFSINATTAADALIAPATKTAILVPICNEDVPRVFAGVRATWDSICRTGLRDQFELFILSDTYTADIRAAEVQAWLQLCREVDGFGHIFYRRRTHRIKRKSGNIADWCRRWGSRFKYMVILDADSVMSGECLKRLVQLMEKNETAGIIQTAPRASGRETLYARIQQFATRVYGPLFTAGLHFWQLGESHYWGHNAIIRVAPFMQHCALGRLSGRGALSGEIMSHDFVEAALMRRAGWGVWIAYDLPGSWEEMPPTLLDELQRDQRWCMGNLQNFRLFFSQGLHPAHRAVFMTGVMAYLSAPLWFLFLVLSTALLAVFVLSEPQYFTQPYQLFPTWPRWHPEWAMRLFGGTMTLLFLPKILSLLLLICSPAEWRGFGGTGRLVAGVVVESLFSAALAPIRMLFHTRYVTSALLGFSIKWKSPPRDDAQTPWSQAVVRHGGGSLLGLAWLGGVYWLNPNFLPWLLPVAGSLVVAVPLSVWSSRVKLGRAARNARLFLIPEEAIPPRELRWLRAGLRRARPPADFRAAVADPVINALMTLQAGRLRKHTEAQRAERVRLFDQWSQQPPKALAEINRNRVLSDPDALASLHLRVWTDDGADPQWRSLS